MNNQQQIQEKALCTHKHLGKILRTIRVRRGMSQNEVAKKTPYTQSCVSRYESQPALDDDILYHFAKAFDMTIQDIKEFEPDEDVTIIIENNTFNDDSHPNLVAGKNANADYNNTYSYPIEKVVELYEGYLKAERKNQAFLEEKNIELKKKIEDLENEIAELKKLQNIG